MTVHLQPPNTPYHPAWYIARPHEEQLALTYLEYGQPVLLWGPRRQGRTWLWTHIAEQWKSASPADGRHVAPIYLHTFPADAFTSLDACLRAFAAALLEALGDDPDPFTTLEAAWSGRGDPKTKLNALLTRTIFPRIHGPLLLILDRADLLVGLDFYNAFSGLLRSWAERARTGEPWSRLRLLVTVSTHPARLSTDINQSFFYNLSDPIQVGDLDRAQIADLAARHGVTLPPADLDRLMDLAGGHPYLLRAILFDLAGQRYTLNDLTTADPPASSLAGAHLRQHRTRLDASPELAQAFTLLAKDPAATVRADLLDALIRQGLIRQGEGGTHPLRYRLYERLLQPDPLTPPARRRARIFYSYAPADEALRERLEVHLKLLERQGLIDPWHRHKLLPGAERLPTVDRYLDQADIILLLVTADFLASDACWDIEMKRALERHDAREAVVVPVILRPCDWKVATQISKLEALPQAAVPVTRWTDPEDAWVDIAQGLRRLIAEWPPSAPRTPPA